VLVLTVHLLNLSDDLLLAIDVGDESLDGHGVGKTTEGLDVDGLLGEVLSGVKLAADDLNELLVLLLAAEVNLAVVLLLLLLLPLVDLVGAAVAADDLSESDAGGREDGALLLELAIDADALELLHEVGSGPDEVLLEGLKSVDGLEGGKLLLLDEVKKELSGIVGARKTKDINEDLALNLLELRDGLGTVVLIDVPEGLDLLLVKSAESHGKLNNLVAGLTLKLNVVGDDDLRESLDHGDDLVLKDFTIEGLVVKGKVLKIELVAFGETVGEIVVLLGGAGLFPVLGDGTVLDELKLEEGDSLDLLLAEGKDLLVKSLDLFNETELAVAFNGHVVVVGGESLNEVLLGVEVDGATLSGGLLPARGIGLHVLVKLLGLVGGANVLATLLIVTVVDEATITTETLKVVPGLGEVKVVVLLSVGKDLVGGLEVTSDTLLLATVDNGLTLLKTLLAVLVHEGVVLTLAVLGLANGEDSGNTTVDIDDLLGHTLGGLQLLNLVVLDLDEDGTVLLDGFLSGVRNTIDATVFDVFDLLIEGTRHNVAKAKTEDLSVALLLVDLDGEDTILLKTGIATSLKGHASSDKRTVVVGVLTLTLEKFGDHVSVLAMAMTAGSGNSSHKGEEGEDLHGGCV
jgi:hypothetical protein